MRSPLDDYASVLTAAWQAHLAPREPDAPTVVSLFAGCGGSGLGYSMAGYRELAAVEWDAHAADHLRANFPGLAVWQGDIRELDGAELLRLAGLRPGDLDVLDGSPPCQGFSQAGKRQVRDARNTLFREYVRLLDALRPRALVMENVSGMVRGPMTVVFAEAMRALKASGYRVRCRLLDARWYLVPQRRQRVIFVGVREDLEVEPSHPEPLRRPPTVREAFRGVPDDGTGARVGPQTRMWKVMRRVAPGDHEPGHFSHLRLAWDAPSPTITCGVNGISHYHVWHPAEHRVITLAECRRLASFPDGYRFTGKAGEVWTRIGNSVPPLLMRAVAGHVRGLLAAAGLERAS